MRFILAIVSFVIALGLIGAGVAQRTIFAAPDSVTASANISSNARVTVLDSKTLHSLVGRQTVTISGPGKIFAAYGRAADVRAWIGTATYNRVSFSAATPRLTNAVQNGKTVDVPDPRGSDLWLEEHSGTSTLVLQTDVPEGISLLVASDGTSAAPGRIAVQWPLDNRTPWVGPLLAAGALFLILAFALYLWAVVHLRRARGPRRKTAKMPKVPRQRRYKPGKSSPVRSKKPAVRGGRRSAARMTAIVPVVLIGTLALGGCSAELWPQVGASSASPAASPSASASVATAAVLDPPAVTVSQLKQIVSRVSAVATKADADQDLALLKTRFEGPALALREANYAIRHVDSTAAAPAVIPSGDIRVTLPQQSDTWPKWVFTVVQDAANKTVPPVGLMMLQNTPRDNFKVVYATALEASAVLPKVAPASVGALRLSPDNKLLLMAPDKLALAYGDILEKGADSASLSTFNISKDTLIALIGLDARKALLAKVPTTAAMTFVNTDGGSAPIALGSNDAGAIVAVYLNETVTVKPVEAGASVNPEGAVKSLSGITGTTKGTVAVYGDQLLMYVPPASTPNAKIMVLGFTTGLISAKELP